MDELVFADKSNRRSKADPQKDWHDTCEVCGVQQKKMLFMCSHCETVVHKDCIMRWANDLPDSKEATYTCPVCTSDIHATLHTEDCDECDEGAAIVDDVGLGIALLSSKEAVGVSGQLTSAKGDADSFFSRYATRAGSCRSIAYPKADSPPRVPSGRDSGVSGSAPWRSAPTVISSTGRLAGSGVIRWRSSIASNDLVEDDPAVERGGLGRSARDRGSGEESSPSTSLPAIATNTTIRMAITTSAAGSK